MTETTELTGDHECVCRKPHPYTARPLISSAENVYVLADATGDMILCQPSELLLEQDGSHYEPLVELVTRSATGEYSSRYYLDSESINALADMLTLAMHQAADEASHQLGEAIPLPKLVLRPRTAPE